MWRRSGLKCYPAKMKFLNWPSSVGVISSIIAQSGVCSDLRLKLKGTLHAKYATFITRTQVYKGPDTAVPTRGSLRRFSCFHFHFCCDCFFLLTNVDVADQKVAQSGTDYSWQKVWLRLGDHNWKKMYHNKRFNFSLSSFLMTYYEKKTRTTKALEFTTFLLTF